MVTSIINNQSVEMVSMTNAAIPRIRQEVPIWLIPCYSIILFFAVIGNLLVISTLVKNRRIRTITNIFLLNLAISDMLLGVLCMPVTLVGTLIRHFIFGEILCKLIQFAQAASVAVSSWTLVAISCERYYAICHPLRSRTWQTINHAYKIIGFIWIASMLCMTPIAVFSQLIVTSRQGLHKCREQWPRYPLDFERFYNIFLDLILLVLPLIILSVAYILITRTLYAGMKPERSMITEENRSKTAISGNTQVDSNIKWKMLFRTRRSTENTLLKTDAKDKENKKHHYSQQCLERNSFKHSKIGKISESNSNRRHFQYMDSGSAKTTDEGNLLDTTIGLPHLQDLETPKLAHSFTLESSGSALRRSNEKKNIENKKRVLKMLFVLVLEFFICWTPLYVINTCAMFIGPSFYKYVDYTSISFFQLLAYSSSCCNPITYCFMNAGFRRSFLDLFKGLQYRQSYRNFLHKKHRKTEALFEASYSLATKNSVTILCAEPLRH